MFLKGSLGALGAAAFYGISKTPSGYSSATDQVLASIFGNPGIAYAQAGSYPANKMSAELPATVTEISLTTPHTIKEIAPGLAFEVWGYNDSGPGPHLHVREGDTIKFSMTNTAEIQHSMDFHAAQLDWSRYYQAVDPGATLEFEWKANFPGAFMYHCGTPPVLSHISNGMHGAIIVQPRDGWPEPAREYVLVQHEWYLGAAGDDGVRRGDSVKMNAATPDLVVFNGYVNQYQENPLVADPGELVRIHVVNCGPTVWSAFHVIGAIFEAAYPEGNPKNKQYGMQTVSIAPGGSYTVELRVPDAGLYPFVTHSFAYTGKGALGILKVGEPDSSLPVGGH
jgi:nitrite reductase (NO-forming)